MWRNASTCRQACHHDPDLATACQSLAREIGDPTVADGILDRLVHNAHRIEMRGDSMRKKRGT
jgi:DNA replication protein DnaC